MEKVVLNATKRDISGKQVKALRRAGKLPAVIYGHLSEPVNITLDFTAPVWRSARSAHPAS